MRLRASSSLNSRVNHCRLAEKEALVGGEAIDHLLRLADRLVRDRDPAQIRDRLAHDKLPLMFRSPTLKPENVLDARRALLVRRRVGGRPVAVVAARRTCGRPPQRAVAELPATAPSKKQRPLSVFFRRL